MLSPYIDSLALLRFKFSIDLRIIVKVGVENYCSAFCIEVTPEGTNSGDGILVLRNGVVAGSIPSKPDFTETRKFYFGDFDFKNDIIELRHNGGNDGTTIHVDLIDQAVSTRVLFGSNADIDWIRY